MARYPGHLWHIDLTVVPTADGLAAPWHPLSLPQSWPLAWWVAIAVDHFSRCAMGFGVFTKEPTSEQVKQWFADLIETTGMKPKHVITDQGSQFTGSAFVNWCKHPMNNVRQRFGAVEKCGSVAVVERAILSMNDRVLSKNRGAAGHRSL